jgi:predicted phage tail protein
LLIKVVLHGYFAAFHDGPILIHCNTAAEAVEGVTRQLLGFAPCPIRGRHRAKVVGFETEESLYKQLDQELEFIHIVPQLAGGKSGGLLQILLGVALVAVGFFMFGGTALGSILMKVGALAILGGLSAMLAPKPQTDVGDQQQRSSYLGAPKNTVTIGTRIPILYGRHLCFGHFLSFDINAIEYNPK